MKNLEVRKIEFKKLIWQETSFKKDVKQIII